MKTDRLKIKTYKQRQTILIGDKHIEHISTGQQLNLQLLLTLLSFLFTTPHIFLNSILFRPANRSLAFATCAQANLSVKPQISTYLPTYKDIH